MPFLDIVDLSAGYGGAPILNGVNLVVGKGEVISLIGPSGSGKSTLLRVLIGLTAPSSGQVSIDGTPVDYASKASVRALRRRMSIVFQQFNLFQNMTALANICLAPVKTLGVAPADAEARGRDLLASVGLADKADSYPDQLSGGQQQRVAIARALAMQPEILLLDEITSALDPERVGEVLDTVRALAATGISMLLVSHEMSFVREISTRVVMMDAGRVVESGPPAQIFTAPQAARTKAFIGAIIRH
ncbi:amino acid ABC transporter ATP-binding protein [Sandarakinorhabdus sp. DWP1-3-1]|uniref:amino acid ABC transporter ATP-binding protein n=1 Tax=Sandarakinorhabdus sp. DWP1-3-1 TaxID=2804627 RepID=UPI003CF04B4F